jgi:hypothetical protein
MFRRECFFALGGYTPMRFGGEDTFLLHSARMKGWDVKAFDDLIAFHLKVPREFKGILTNAFRYGASDYQLGSRFGFVFFKSMSRMFTKPLVLGGLAHLWGFVWASANLPGRGVPPDFAQYYCRHQWSRLGSMCRIVTSVHRTN